MTGRQPAPQFGRYEIIATLGPASNEAEAWNALLEAGATQFRLNTSHLSVDALHRWLHRLYAHFSARGEAVPVVLDLQGSKWRLGELEPLTLPKGARVELMEASHVPSGSGQLLEQSEANEEDAGARILLPVPHPDFFEAARRTAGRILMNDARVQLEIVDTAANAVQARVLTAGPVSRGKGITLADSSYRTESLGEKDRRITETAGSWPFVRFAVSYVRDAAEMEVYRRQFGEGHDVIAKIERPTAVEDIREIARFCDELWLCRGDLGAEMGLAAMAAAVSRVSRLVKTLEVPCLMAGQVLEHLTLEPHPTRAEVVQLHDLLEDGYCGVVLSDETATGRYPAAACGTAALFRGKRGAGE